MNTVKLGDICNLRTGGTPSRAHKEYFENGNIKWLVSGDIHKGEILDCEGRITEAGLTNSNARMLPLNSVMIALNGQGKTRATVAMLRTEAACNQSLVSIYPKDDTEVLPEYIYWNLKGRYDELRKLTGDDGNERRGLNMIIIRNIDIPEPPDIQEQRRVVEWLDAAFEKIDRAIELTENNVNNVKNIFDSRLKNIYEKKRQDWESAKLGDLTTKIGSGATPKGGKSAYRAEGISLIRSLNIYDHYFKYEKLAHISDEQANKLSNVELEKDDVLLNITGASVARCNIVPIDCLPGRVNQHVSIIRLNKQMISPEFVHYLLISEPYKRRLLGIGEGKGSTRQAITKAQIQEFTISFPTHITQQEAIVRELDELLNRRSHLIKMYQYKLKLLSALKHSLLAQAFFQSEVE